MNDDEIQRFDFILDKLLKETRELLIKCKGIDPENYMCKCIPDHLLGKKLEDNTTEVMINGVPIKMKKGLAQHLYGLIYEQEKSNKTDIVLHYGVTQNSADVIQCIGLSRKLVENDFSLDQTIDKNWKYGDHIVASCDENRLFVCKKGGDVVGYATIEKADVDYRDVKIIEITELFVKEEWRGKRVGKNLVDNIYLTISARNHTLIVNDGKVSLQVRVSSKNEKAIDFYRREGFEGYDLILEKEVE